MINNLTKIFKISFSFRLFELKYKPCYLILGTQNKLFLEKLLKNKKKKFYLDISSRKINLAYFLNFFYWFSFLKIFINNNFTTAYYHLIIRNLKCNCVITFYDNDINFYKLKKNLPSIKFIAIQNGARHMLNDIFGSDEIKYKKNLKADIIFVFNNEIKKLFEKYITAKIVVLGSFKNNIVKKFYVNKKNENLAYISQYRKSIFLNKNFYAWNNYKISSKDFYKNDKTLIQNLANFCKKNKIKFYIICATKYSSEKKYFRSLVNNEIINFIEKTNDELEVYKSIHMFNTIVCSWSTLGYECLSRNIKTCFFRQKIDSFTDRSFGWPSNTLKETFFYTENVNEKKINEILKKIYFMSQAEWINKTQYAKKKVIAYDYQNNKLNELINNV